MISKTITQRFFFFLCLVFVVTGSPLFAQKKLTDYIVIDTVYRQGKTIPMSGGRVQFQQSNGFPATIYSPKEAREYGYDGKVYKSLSISDEHRFFLQLVSGAATLYKGDDFYILKRGDRLFQFNRKNYRTILSKEMDCFGNDKSLSQVSYTKSSLQNFVYRYNKGECNSDNFPYRKLGIIGAYGVYKFNLSATLGAVDKLSDNSRAIFIGVFGDFPVYKPSNIYISTELYFMKSKPSFYGSKGDNSDFIAFDLSGLTAPVGIKWIFIDKKIKSYFKIGGLLSYIKAHSPTGLVQTVSLYDGAVLEVDKQYVSDSGGIQFGFTSGLGLEIPCINKQKIHLELKYIKALNGSFNSIRMNYSGLSFGLGFNF